MSDDEAGPAASILDLDDNILLQIVEYLDGGQQRLVPFYQRRHLSVESFRNPPPPERGSAASLSGFRLSCRRFADVAARPQWVRVTTRFSEAGLCRLNNIASSPRIARHVRKFCYMVPIFFDEGYDDLDKLPEDLTRALTKRISGRSAYKARIEERRRIIKSRRDAEVLEKAFKAFTDLTHVQLCRLQDLEDGRFLRFLHKHPRATEHIRADWSSACHHSTKTISEALLTSKSGCERFSSPALNVESAQFLAQKLPGQEIAITLSRLTERLKCLELHFVEPTNIDDRIRKLTPGFVQVFNTATNLEALHVGFPESNPLSISLEDVFHKIKWKNLVAFGIQGWSLDAKEIREFAARHSTKLKGLRLRSVLLKDGSMWKDVLYYLKENLHLSWVSLRKIGYETHFLEKQSRMGVEWTDSDDEDEPDETAVSDFSDDDVGHVSGDGEEVHTYHAPSESVTAPPDDVLELEDTFELSSNEEDSSQNSDPERFLHTMEFPRHLHDPVRRIRCNCREQVGGRHTLSPASADALGDDGADPDEETRKMWESWVVWMCPIHKGKLVATAGSSSGGWET